jgi:hypothetical protein
MRTPFPGLVVAAVLLLAGLAVPAAAAPELPPVGTDFDYQLGGNRSVPDHVGIVVRDRTAAPLAADTAYNVCYVNGFQTQPDQKRFWRHHWSLVLKNDGRAVTDSAWGEWLLDIRTDHKRTRLARIMGRWVAGCADDGYDAVEYDNLDSFTRSRHLLEPADANAYARRLVRKGHAAGLAVAQKNRAGWDGREVGFDFAIAEECARWHECGSYVDHYGRHVLAVEYRRKDFRRACRGWSDRIAVVRRDLALSKHGVRRWC